MTELLGAETTAYTDDRGLWVEVGFLDPDDGQRHAVRTVALPPGTVLPLDAVRGQLGYAEEILTHELTANREDRRQRRRLGAK